MAESTNQFVDIYTDMRNRVFTQLGKRRSSNNVPLELFIEWDRLRMILNPRANLSSAQMKLGVIPENWRE